LDDICGESREGGLSPERKAKPVHTSQQASLSVAHTGEKWGKTGCVPLDYLTTIGQVHVLEALFGKVLIPGGVLAALRHPKAPEAVARWSQSLPEWSQLVRVREMDHTIPLGKGEAEAISLALERQVAIVLLEERKGRVIAQSRGLLAVGTLNLIDVADEMGLLNGLASLNELRNATLRADPGWSSGLK
jgi:predicted nucleic acid-binding protein